MNDHIDKIRRHYSIGNLREHIIRQLETRGLQLERLTRDDLAAFDEFHAGGRDMTRILARAVDLKPGLELLDIGCGIGGPARTLAADFGCRVIGLDATEDFIEAAQMLTEHVGLTDRVEFTTGSAVNLPFPDQRFDIVWLQFVLPNIHDKDRLVSEIRRVLKPGGRVAFHEVMKGISEDLDYPTFWADSPTMTFLDTPENFERRLDSAGFNQLFYRNYTQPSLEWYKAAAERAKQHGPKQLNIGIIIPEDAGRKSMNVTRNLERDRIKIFLGAFERPA